MIPRVQKWRIRVVATDAEPEQILFMDGPTKTLIRIGFRMDYPRFWGREIKISLAMQGRKKCDECRNPFDDNPGKELCKTCQDWRVIQ